MRRDVLTYFLILFIQFSVNYAGLYNEEDAVFILNNNTFDSNVVGSNNSWIVEFYNSWCGHCIRFAPHWKNLANECKGWKELINVAAIDCADKENTALCMHYQIEMYPTIVYFSAGAKARPDKLKLTAENSIDQIKLQMIDFVTNQSLSNLNRQQLKPFVPLENLGDIEYNPDVKTVIIYEKETSYLGKEIILNLSDRQKSITVRRMISDVIDVTSSYLLSKDGQLDQLIRSEDKSDHLKEITSLIDEREDSKKQSIGSKSEDKTNDSAKNETVMDDPNVNWKANHYMRLHESDLTSALLYSLRHEIPLKGHLDPHNINIISYHIQVLVKHLPIRVEWISKLETLVERIEKKSLQDDFKGLSGEEWLEIVDQLFEKDKYPDEQNWISCKGSTSGFRGYPCGLWMTFHTITVNTASKEKDDDCVEALLSIKNYINYFFGCQECRRNFMRGATKMKSLVNNCNQATIFLWRSHNKANQRLKGDPSEDPSHPKTLFPNKYQCPFCHGHSGKASISGMSDGWVEEEVLKFLGGMYGHESILGVDGPMNHHLTGNGSLASNERSKSIAADGNSKLNKFKVKDLASSDAKSEQVRMDVVAKASSYVSVVNIFNRFDVGVCMAFYFACILLIVGLYLHFMRKKKMCRSKYPV